MQPLARVVVSASLLAALGLLAVAPAGLSAPSDAGATVYQQRCALCHQAGGEGVPGAFPPLAGHLPDLVGAGPQGRTYLIHVVLFGLEGPIQARGQAFSGTMPAWGALLSDEEVAAVLNYVLTSWGNEQRLPQGHRPISAAEVRAERAKGLTSRQVHGERASLVARAEAPVGPAPVGAAGREPYEARQQAEYDFHQIAERYRREHPGKGAYADYWEPIPVQMYWNPVNFYRPPDTVKGEVTRAQCVTCHQSITPGVVHAWARSAHANLDRLRELPDSDPRAYKKAELARVEQNLRKLGILREGQHLAEVSCIDCHGEVGASSIRHDQDLRLPIRTVCGTCHLTQFAEAESERDQTWPRGEWPKGHPSHSVDWKANVETAVWAAMPQRAVAQGCDMCHYQQNRCDGCHTRHAFSAAEARMPMACATCHSGVDHNEFENYLLSKHGTIFQTEGHKWNFEAPLKDALTAGGYTAPTCAFCHFEFQGEFSHNLVRKVRWAFNPTPEIAQGIAERHPWYEERKQAWVRTCSNCHSPRFAQIWLETADQVVFDGLKLLAEARAVVEGLYKDGLLVGQATNRPAPPAPEKDAPGAFFQLFWAKGNNPSRVERVFANMWEHDMLQLYKGAMHMNPGGFTYSAGWSPMLERYTDIMDENTRLREQAEWRKRIEQRLSGSSARSPNRLLPFVAGALLMGAGAVQLRRPRLRRPEG